MDANDNDSSNGFDIEENFVGVDEAEICPADDETTSTPSLEATTDKPDASVSVPVLVPETTEGKLVNLVPSLAHPMFEEVVTAIMLHQIIECKVPTEAHSKRGVSSIA